MQNIKFTAKSKILGAALLVVVLYHLVQVIPEDVGSKVSESIPGQRKVVLIAVPSVISRVRERHSVRDSWGHFLSYRHKCAVDLKLVFFVGLPNDSKDISILKQEQELFEDIAQLKINESYYSLSNKTRLLFEAVAEMQRSGEREFDYIIKTDEDTFVNTPLICANFAKFKPTDVYGGKCHQTSSKPYRAGSKNPKFELTFQEYSRDIFPPHCEGPFYYMSRDLVFKLVDVGFRKAQYLKFEDVYLGLALEAAGLKFTDLEKYNKNYHYLYSFQKTAGLEIGVSPSYLRFKWAFHPVVSSGRLKEIYLMALEENRQISQQGIIPIATEESFVEKLQKWLTPVPPPLRYKKQS